MVLKESYRNGKIALQKMETSEFPSKIKRKVHVKFEKIFLTYIIKN